MVVKDISAVHQDLSSRREQIVESARSAATEVCAEHPPLRDAVVRLLNADHSSESVFRLLPFPIAGALTGDGELASPVCVTSRLWWAGAETFDDLNDGQFDSLAVGLSAAEATVASAACISLLPQAWLARRGLPRELELDLVHELAETSLHSASGQLSDVSREGQELSWASVMKSYAGKSGAPYARDAVMTALLVGEDKHSSRLWRAFGALFGVLRQLANDQAGLSLGDESDLANGNRTLLLAHAGERTPGEDLLAWSDRARRDLGARRELLDLLTASDTLASFGDRVGIIRHSLTDLWQQLVGPSEHRDIVQWMIDMSATAAVPGATS